MSRYRDRRAAGQYLAQRLMSYADRQDVLVLALPRGGVPVAAEVARALDAPLDIFVVRKLGVPAHEELAMGAVATGGVRVLNPEVLTAFTISLAEIEDVATRELAELRRREQAYRGDRPSPDVRGRTVIVVDDGLATGSTMTAAVLALRQEEPERIVVAVPVGAPATCEEVGRVVDDIVCAAMPDPFHAVGLWYEDFDPTTDEEVRLILRQMEHNLPPAHRR